MRDLDPTIKRQQVIRKQLWTVLQGDVIGKLRSKMEDFDTERNQRTFHAANNIKVSDTVMPELYTLLAEVMLNLNFYDNTELYITSEKNINAYAYESKDKEKPHIIVVSSGLVERLADDEIKYMLGHEIGHIISHDSEISELYNYVFKTDEDDWEEEVPLGIMNRFHEYQLMSEFIADRYGYLGCMNIEACVSTFFKERAGFDIFARKVCLDDLLKQNLDQLCLIQEYGRLEDNSHPMFPFRVQALVEFAACDSQEELDFQMDNLLQLIPGVHHTETDNAVAMLLTAAGMKVAMADGKIADSELDTIVSEVSIYVLEATEFCKRIKKKNLDKIIEDTLPRIKEECPDKLVGIFNYLVAVAFADRITDEKMELLMELGVRLDMDEDDILKAMSDYVKEHFCSLSVGL